MGQFRPGIYEKYRHLGISWDTPRYPKDNWDHLDLRSVRSTNVLGIYRGVLTSWDILEYPKDIWDHLDLGSVRSTYVLGHPVISQASLALGPVRIEY